MIITIMIVTRIVAVMTIDHHQHHHVKIRHNSNGRRKCDQNFPILPQRLLGVRKTNGILNESCPARSFELRLLLTTRSASLFDLIRIQHFIQTFFYCVVITQQAPITLFLFSAQSHPPSLTLSLSLSLALSLSLVSQSLESIREASTPHCRHRSLDSWIDGSIDRPSN